MTSFTEHDLTSLANVNRRLSIWVPKCVQWNSMDYSEILEPRLNYEDQTEIDPHCVETASALMFAKGLDPGKVARALMGEYMGAWRDVQKILHDVRPYISKEDYMHLTRILMQGCPAECLFEELNEDKLLMMQRGNQKNFVENPECVKEALNKEDKHSHILPVHELMCFFSPYCRHTCQAIVIKPGKIQGWSGTDQQSSPHTTWSSMT